MQNKIIKRSIEEQILATQERLQQLQKNKQKKINRTILNSFNFLNSESGILKILGDKAIDKDFNDRLKTYIFEYEEFKAAVKQNKSGVLIKEKSEEVPYEKLEDDLNEAFSNYKTGDNSGN